MRKWPVLAIGNLVIAILKSVQRARDRSCPCAPAPPGRASLQMVSTFLTRDDGDASTFGGDDDTAWTILSDNSGTSLDPLVSTNGSSTVPKGKRTKDLIVDMFCRLQAQRDELRRQLQDEVANRQVIVDQTMMDPPHEAARRMMGGCLKVERKAASDLASAGEENRNERDTAKHALIIAAREVSKATKQSIRSAQRAQRCERKCDKACAELEKTWALVDTLSRRVRELEEALQVERRANSRDCDHIRTMPLATAGTTHLS